MGTKSTSVKNAVHTCPKIHKKCLLRQIYFTIFIDFNAFFFGFLVSKEPQLISRAVARGSLVAGAKDMSWWVACVGFARATQREKFYWPNNFA